MKAQPDLEFSDIIFNLQHFWEPVFWTLVYAYYKGLLVLFNY